MYDVLPTDYAKTLSWEAIERITPILPFVSALQLFGGEPLLFSRIRDLYRLAAESSTQITMISNGSLLTPDMVDSIVANRVHCIKFSIDAGTPATYKKIRGGDFFSVLKGIARLAQRKKETGSPFPIFDLHFLAMRSNVKELTRLVAMAAELKARAVSVFYPMMHREDLLGDCVFFDQNYSDDMLSLAREVAANLGVTLNLPPLFRESEGLEQSTTTHEFCQSPWTTALVDADGNVSLCCAGDAVIGNLHENAFDAIWNGSRAKALRAVVNTPHEPAFCKTCRVRKADPRAPELHIPPELLRKLDLPARAQTAAGSA